MTIRPRGWLARRLRARSGRAAPQGRLGVLLVGHRTYVGGLWDELGSLQFDLLLEHGLRPSDVLVDVGCGALRGGVRFIPYLEPGHYLGIDRERSLIRAGKRELGRTLIRERRPELVVSSDFSFDRFTRRPTFGVAQSLFSHLDADDITLCLTRLREAMEPGGRFYATFFEGEEHGETEHSHSHANFFYPRERLAQLGRDAGWDATYIGAIGHPRGQVVMLFTAR